MFGQVEALVDQFLGPLPPEFAFIKAIFIILFFVIILSPILISMAIPFMLIKRR